ncbi:hypothetical protein EHS25_005828 [Saitozyma podzolica]|uniref:Amidohydrolase-related domain-containing protein n=1 Tax=Saitozyma podzolica TaxID=1890683 RepID=A0A427XVB2_9TREE|nr:hypothetical protein EHS25_005828 [Saitozyma podzolica]
MPSHPQLDPAELPEGSWDTHIHIFDPARHPYEPDWPYIPPHCSVEQLLHAVPCSNFCIVIDMPEGTRPELALESVAKISSVPGRTARATIVLDFDRLSNEQLQQLRTKGVRSIRIHAKGAIATGFFRRRRSPRLHRQSLGAYCTPRVESRWSASNSSMGDPGTHHH